MEFASRAVGWAVMLLVSFSIVNVFIFLFLRSAGRGDHIHHLQIVDAVKHNFAKVMNTFAILNSRQRVRLGAAVLIEKKGSGRPQRERV